MYGKWEVKPIRKHSEGKDYNAFRVQRAVREGERGVIETAFAHESESLCTVIMLVLNEWEKMYPPPSHERLPL